MEETPSEDSNIGLANIDIDSTDFYENVRTEIDSDLARMKKNVLIFRELRRVFEVGANVLDGRGIVVIVGTYICHGTDFKYTLTAAEVEVESAALFHAELWYVLIESQNILEENSEEEEKGDKTMLDDENGDAKLD